MLVETTNIVGEKLLLPDWHPQIQLERHNERLAKAGRWEKVRAYSEQDLRRFDLPLDPRKTKDARVQRIIFGVPASGWEHPQDWETDDEVASQIKATPIHRLAFSYFVYNSALATTAAPVKQPTGTAIRTMVQVRTALSVSAQLTAWGCSFDGSAAATPGQVELFENTAAATMSTAYAAADIQPYNPYQGTANTAGASGVPLNLSTTTSGFATAAVTEGTVAGYRGADLLMAPPTGPYVLQWPLGREFTLTPQNYLRIRVTFGTTVNMYAWLLLEI